MPLCLWALHIIIGANNIKIYILTISDIYKIKIYILTISDVNFPRDIDPCPVKIEINKLII